MSLGPSRRDTPGVVIRLDSVRYSVDIPGQRPFQAFKLRRWNKTDNYFAELEKIRHGSYPSVRLTIYNRIHKPTWTCGIELCAQPKPLIFTESNPSIALNLDALLQLKHQTFYTLVEYAPILLRKPLHHCLLHLLIVGITIPAKNSLSSQGKNLRTPGGVTEQVENARGIVTGSTGSGLAATWTVTSFITEQADTYTPHRTLSLTHCPTDVTPIGIQKTPPGATEPKQRPTIDTGRGGAAESVKQ
ncbi:hypothetical protein AAG570_003342 [Ranatra chinensis]|uniref:Uncharacterized protein n=1 Tax=Ranatra chinensis TaxID=642074 RepID=A0ABD0YRY7_9HEMI